MRVKICLCTCRGHIGFGQAEVHTVLMAVMHSDRQTTVFTLISCHVSLTLGGDKHRLSAIKPGGESMAFV